MDANDHTQARFERMLQRARALLAAQGDATRDEVDVAKASELVAQALAMHPDSSSAWILKCQALSAIGDDIAALAAIEMALRADNKSAEGLYWRAAILSDLGRHSEALRSIHRCFRHLQTDDSWLLEDLYCEKAILLHAIGRNDEAVATYEAGLRRCPRSSLLKAGLAPLKRSAARSTLRLLRGGIG